VSGMVDMRGAADKVQSIVQNVCSTLQTGVSSLASNLPDLHQLEKQHKQLKEGNIHDSDDEQTSDNENGSSVIDDLAPYLPDVNSIEDSQILETCVRDFELGPKDPTEVDAFENDDIEIRSLLMLDCSIAGLDRSVMPDHEELDSLPAIKSSISHNVEVSPSTAIIKSIILSSAADDDLDESNKEFLPTKVSEQPVISNLSNDEFDLDDDSRQLSIDQSIPGSHQSDNGEDSIPYDSHELEVRAAMEELIDEEEILPERNITTDATMNPIPLHTTASKVEEQVVTPTKCQVKDTSKDSSMDDDVEEDFELISADELSLHEDS